MPGELTYRIQVLISQLTGTIPPAADADALAAVAAIAVGSLAVLIFRRGGGDERASLAAAGDVVSPRSPTA